VKDEDFANWAAGHPYARIEASKMFSFGGV
jgi:hypothetical protein